jgi:hypothetical protein
MSQQPGAREAFQQAHRAWRKATAEYEAKVARAVDGRQVAWQEALLREAEELAHLHRDFMEKAKPFVRSVAD